MKDVIIYHGMSGTFKNSAIRSKQGINPGPHLGTKNKFWKTHRNLPVFRDAIQDSSMVLCLLQLARLDDFMNNNEAAQSLYIERGLIDNLFFHYHFDSVFDDEDKPEENRFLIKEILKLESTTLKDSNVKRVLLIQKDVDFIKDVIFKNPVRNSTFRGDLDCYLKTQEIYVDFVKRYHKLDEIYEITDAEKFITETLGQKLQK